MTNVIDIAGLDGVNEWNVVVPALEVFINGSLKFTIFCKRRLAENPPFPIPALGTSHQHNVKKPLYCERYTENHGQKA